MDIELLQNQKQSLSPMMLQSLKILQLPAAELANYVREELADNPTVDPDRLCRDLYADVAQGIPLSFDGDPYAREIPEAETLAAHLKMQLRLDGTLPENLVKPCFLLIDSLDEHGFLTEDPEKLGIRFGFSAKRMKAALCCIRTLSPCGVGAENVTECLLMQLEAAGARNEASERIIRELLPYLARGEEEMIGKILGVGEEKAYEYCKLIRTLEPYPSRGFSSSGFTPYLIPDAELLFTGKDFHVLPCLDKLPQIEILEEYRRLKEVADEETCAYLTLKIEQAEVLQNGIRQRFETLIKIIGCVCRKQQMYLLGERENPMPYLEKEVAAELGLHESTVCRAIDGKVVIFRNRMYLLKSLFSRPVSVRCPLTRKEITNMIREAVRGEDPRHPLSDEKLRIALMERGALVSRRTVALYRSELLIPASSARKKN